MLVAVVEYIYKDKSSLLDEPHPVPVIDDYSEGYEQEIREFCKTRIALVHAANFFDLPGLKDKTLASFGPFSHWCHEESLSLLDEWKWRCPTAPDEQKLNGDDSVG